MKTYHVAFGANLGDPCQTYVTVHQQLALTLGIERVTRSRLYRTRPVGSDESLPYFNGAYLLASSLEPLALFELLARLEEEHGRRRNRRWDARPLDLDFLLAEDQVLSGPNLLVPHFRMHYRSFVLAPLAELDPGVRHPLIGWTAGELWARVRHPHPEVFVVGTDPARRTAAVEHLRRLRPEWGVAEVSAHERQGTWIAHGPWLVAWDREVNDKYSRQDPTIATAAEPTTGWIVVVDDPPASHVVASFETPRGPRRSPVVDGRADALTDVLSELDYFVDSLAPVVPILPPPAAG